MSATQHSPTRQLPSRPNLEQLKNQARDLLKAHQAGAPEVCQRIRASVRRLSKASDSEIREVMVKMGEIARIEGIVALEEFFGDSTVTEGLFCAGMRLAIDGTEPGVLMDLLETRKDALVHGFETRCKMIIAGVMAIRDGHNPRIIDQKLISFYKPQS